MKKKSTVICGAAAILGVVAWWTFREVAPSTRWIPQGKTDHGIPVKDPISNGATDGQSREVRDDDSSAFWSRSGFTNYPWSFDVKKELFERFADTGVLYPFEHSWRRFYRKYPQTQLPFLEIRLRTMDNAGKIVDLSTICHVRFEWITDQLSFEEYRLIPYPKSISSTKWRACEPQNDPEVAQWEAEYQRIAREKNVRVNKTYNCAFGVKILRIPILPEDLEKRYPDLANKIEKRARYDYLLCGKWYRARIFMQNADIPEKYGRYRAPQREGAFVSAYFKTPKAGAVAPGKIKPIDLFVLPNLYPPFDPTERYTKDQIAKGKHIIVKDKLIRVTVSKELIHKYGRLKLYHIHNIQSKGGFSSYNVKPSTPIQIKVWNIRPGGLVLLHEPVMAGQVQTVLVKRNISFDDDEINLGEEADYVVRSPLSFKANLAAVGLKEDEIKGKGLRLVSRIEDTTPVAFSVAEGTLAPFRCNAGAYYVQLFDRNGSYRLIGKVEVTARMSRTVDVARLSKEEQKRWQKFQPKSILSRTN